MTYGKRPPLDEQKSLWEATLAVSGVTTVAGNIGGTSFTDAGLAGAGVGSFISMMVIIYPGQRLLVDSRDIIGFDNVTGEVDVATAFKGGQVPIGTPYKIITSRFTIAEVAALAAALGNPTADMGDVTQSEAASLAAHLKNFRSHSRIHNQGRICLIVPDLADLAGDPQNTAIRAELDKIGTVSLLDQTGVDAGHEDWDVYNLVVVGSNVHATAFVMANLDDLISYHGPIMVCNAAVAEHLLMGTDPASQSTSDTDEFCETIANRVMQKVFGSTGEKVLFDSAQVSDELDMSDADLTELVLMVDTTGDGPGLVVVGWLPAEDVEGETLNLNDGSPLPSGRLFAGCFLHADHLTTLGQWLLRSLARNLAQAHIHPMTVNVKRSYQEQIPDSDFALAVIDTVLTADPPNADAENSIVDIDQKTGRTYVLRSLWVNITDWGAGTQLTFQLWVLVNGVVTSVDSRVIDVLGFHNLMDIFGLPEVHADGIWITAITDVGATGACSGTFNFAEAKK